MSSNKNLVVFKKTKKCRITFLIYPVIRGREEQERVKHIHNSHSFSINIIIRKRGSHAIQKKSKT